MRFHAGSPLRFKHYRKKIMVNKGLIAGRLWPENISSSINLQAEVVKESFVELIAKDLVFHP